MKKFYSSGFVTFYNLDITMDYREHKPAYKLVMCVCCVLEQETVSALLQSTQPRHQYQTGALTLVKGVCSVRSFPGRNCT